MITEINGKTIERMSDVAPFVHSSGETGELNLVCYEMENTFALS